MCRLKIEELGEQASACSQSSYSEEEYAKRLELAMAEIRREAEDQEQQREMQYMERLTAIKQKASAVKNELKERLSVMDNVCEKLRVEKETAIAELEERHRLRLLSIAESQEEQVCYCIQCGILLHVTCHSVKYVQVYKNARLVTVGDLLSVKAIKQPLICTFLTPVVIFSVVTVGCARSSTSKLLGFVRASHFTRQMPFRLPSNSVKMLTIN